MEQREIRRYRLCAHHLHKKASTEDLIEVTGACGLQNTPPGAWETALHNRIEGCTLATLREALYEHKTLLQAWSYRGVPVVFPTEQSDAFLTSLIAQAGESPWIYTRGIIGALDYLQMSFDELLPYVEKAAHRLDNQVIIGKEALDRVLAEIVEGGLPEDKRKLWRGPSMYGNPEKQTVGEAAVSFMLRPCSFSSLVVFGERQGASPTFTSFKNWTGHEPKRASDAGEGLVRKFLHCYGPATLDSFMDWLGCSKKQAQRLWDTVSDEMEPVQLESGTCYMLSEDIATLQSIKGCDGGLLLLGAHDPYLDMRDRTVILEDKTLQRAVWKPVGNPGAIVKEGRIIGIWRTRTTKNALNTSLTVWDPISPSEQQELKELAEGYASFRRLRLKRCTVEGI